MPEIPLENIENLSFEDYLEAVNAGRSSPKYQTLIRANSWGQPYQVQAPLFTEASESQHWAVEREAQLSGCTYVEAIDRLDIST